jgi:hypothetical protein
MCTGSKLISFGRSNAALHEEIEASLARLWASICVTLVAAVLADSVVTLSLEFKGDFDDSNIGSSTAAGIAVVFINIVPDADVSR